MKRAFAAALAAVLVGACGHRAAPPVAAPVPRDLVPATLPSVGALGDLTVSEYANAKRQFARVGPSSLVADGALFEIRRGATLIGTLQLSALKPAVDVADARQRDSIVGQVMGGPFTRITVDTVKVAAGRTADKTTYVWFGRGFFELVQLKGRDVAPEVVLRALLGYQRPSGKLRLPTVRTR